MNLQEKLKELDAVSHGDYWIVRCPVCGHKEAFLYLDDIEKQKINSLYKIPNSQHLDKRLFTELSDRFDTPSAKAEGFLLLPLLHRSYLRGTAMSYTVVHKLD